LYDIWSIEFFYTFLPSIFLDENFI
jgi:hypothetical protein